jgi:WD40 repeat protein/serine/threonine protein kinase/DNA-binding XRE family transcriptional regulator
MWQGMMQLDASFGQWLKRLRRELDLTQDELARRVGCATATIQKIEADERRPSRQIAERLADCLELTSTGRDSFLRIARARPSTSQPLPPARLVAQALEERNVATRAPRGARGYELRERIGVGGFGTVYRAEQPGVGREVAVKVILPIYANHPEFIRRFEAEAQIVARLEHPHIVPLYDFWREPDGAYLVMRYMRGGSLHAALSSGPLPLDNCTRILDQLAAALAVAHRAGVVHRDLKPANVLLDEEGNAYLADFGIAKDPERPDPDDQTKPDIILGSLAYLSPEQIRDEPVTPRTDIYSLGVLLYEILTGKQPFATSPPAELFRKQLHEPLPALQERRPGLPAALDAVIRRATAKEPAERYANAASLLADWRQATAHERPPPNDQRRADDELLSFFLHSSGAAIATQLTAIENPYKGLRAFGEADAADFFGREALLQRLLERMAEPVDRSWELGVEVFAEVGSRTPNPQPLTPSTRFLAVVGPSGSGKSSVVRAGLLPALRRGGLPGSERWFMVELLPGARPLEELEAALLRVAVNPPASLLEQLAADERGLIRAAKRILPDDPEIELVLIIDQFEELFTLVEDEAARIHVLDSLVAVVNDPRSRLRVVATLRADFYDRPLRYGGFGALVRERTELVLPLTVAELRQAIAGPAERAGLTLEPGLVTAIVKEVGEQPGALPLLQYALTELFERRDGHTLTLGAYRASGGVLGALARRADELYARLDPEGQEAVRQLFLRLVTLGEGVEDTRRRVRLAELAVLTVDQGPKPSAEQRSEPSSLLVGHRSTIADSVLELYGRYRLLTFDRDPITRGPTVEVAHEALIRSWGRLREWLDASREALRVQRRLMVAAAEWRHAGQDASFLAIGARLAQFEALADAGDLALNAEEGAYLQASIDEQERRVVVERARQERELGAARALAETQTVAARRLRRRAVFLAGALLLALVAAVAAGFFANSSANLATQNAVVAATAQAEAQLRATQQSIAQANFTRAEAQRLAAEANTLLKSNASSELIALLALRSMNLQYSPQGDAALMGAAALDYPAQIFTGHERDVNAVAVSRDGKYALTGGVDHTARLWDIQTGTAIHQFAHDDQVRLVAFSPDGRYALTGDEHVRDAGLRVRLWNTQTGVNIREFSSPASIYTSIFSADGQTVLMGCGDAAVRIWDWRTGQLMHTLALPARPADIVWAVTSDGRYAITRPLNGYTMRLWSLREAIQQLQEFTYSDSVADTPSSPYSFSPDGKFVLIGDGDGTTHLWDAMAGKEIRTFKNKTSVYSVAFSPDGRKVLISSQDKTVRVWDRQTGEELYRLPQIDDVWSLAFSPDGNSVLLGGLAGAVRLWNVPPRMELPIFNRKAGPAIGLAFSPDGVHLATSGVGVAGGLQLWETQTGELERVFTEDEFGQWGVRFSPDGRYLISGNLSGVARLWDVATGEELRRFVHSPSMQIYDLAFSPDGKHILIAGPDPGRAIATAQVWDVATGEVLLRLGFPVQDDPIFRVAFSPDGQTMLTAHGIPPAVKLWEAETGEQIWQITSHTGWVTGAAFSPDGASIATASFDKTARLWDAKTGHEIRQFIGHTDGLWSVAFSPDGKTIATASTDGTARLWDVQTGRELRRFVGHTAGVENMIFSPDGRYIATASDDGTARLWDVDYHTTMQYLCSRLLRDFTDGERAQYNIPDQAPTCPKM